MDAEGHHVFCGMRTVTCYWYSAQPDESDGELDTHQDEDRTDPKRTEEEGDILCYISCS